MLPSKVKFEWMVMRMAFVFLMSGMGSLRVREKEIWSVGLLFSLSKKFVLLLGKTRWVPLFPM